MDPNLLDGPHGADRLQLRAPLCASAEDGDDVRFLAGQQVRGRAGGRARAQRGQVRPVHHGGRSPCRCVHDHDERVDERQSLRRIVVEDGDNLDRHLVVVGQVGGHKEGNAIVAGHVERHPQRHVGLAGGELGEGPLHRFDCLAHRQCPAHVFAGKDA